MRFDLLSLKLFASVCEEQSIARAAEREHIAPSAVSKRISDLEMQLKSPLFRRTPKGLKLTPSADALLHHARILLRDLAQMESELADHTKGVCGQVRIHASVSTIVQHLPHDLREFLAEHAAIRIDLEQGTSQEVVQAVAANVADIGIFGGCRPLAGLRVYPYRSDRLVILTPVGHRFAGLARVKFADVVAEDLVGPQKGSFLDSLVQRAAAELNHPLNLRVRVNGFETVCSMVAAGLGVGIAPERCARDYVAAGRVAMVPLDEEWATRHWKLCVREESALPPPVRLLMEHLSPEARATARGMRLVAGGRR
ncbi:MAG TPA: LysR family transcriptional regulator [Acetobacteraceae bacterium]|nr:LysR family transcriptional regulator [Acetobacteraceae bacterium]